MKGRVRATLLSALYAAQDGVCAACGEKMTPPHLRKALVSDEGLRASIDHVVPLARGGQWHSRNTVAMHRRCNSAKGSRAPTGCEQVWLAVTNAKLNLSVQLSARRVGRCGSTLADVWPA